jgi:hypothetical protein
MRPNPTGTLGQAAMLSTHQPEDVLRPTGPPGMRAIFAIILAVIGAWFLFNGTGGAPSSSPSPSPPASVTAGGSPPPPP